MFETKADTAGGGAAPFRLAKRFVRCPNGTSMVEFALVLAPFLALLAAILQTALVFFAGRLLDETVDQASSRDSHRAGANSRPHPDRLRQPGMREYFCPIHLQ